MSKVFSAPYYEIRKNFEFGDPIYHNWSRTRDRAGIIKQPYPDDIWVPRRDIEFESGGMWSEAAVREGGRLTDKTVEHLLAFKCVVATDANVNRNVINSFSAMPDQMPLLCEELMNAFAAEFPNVFEFVEIPEVWNETSQGPLPGGPYYLANLLTRLDSWDKEKTKFYEFTRGDGSRYTEAAQTQRYVNGALVAEFPIWRDSLTSDVICTERFRDVAESAGCKEWRFTKLPTS